MISQTGWACDGRMFFPQGCYSGINDYYQTSNIIGYKCVGCDVDICVKCLQYSYHVDNLAANTQQHWSGFNELNGQKQQVQYKKFVIVDGHVKGWGKDEIGEFDINGFETEGKVRFNLKYVAQHMI